MQATERSYVESTAPKKELTDEQLAAKAASRKAKKTRQKERVALLVVVHDGLAAAAMRCARSNRAKSAPETAATNTSNEGSRQHVAAGAHLLLSPAARRVERGPARHIVGDRVQVGASDRLDELHRSACEAPRIF